ncbi:MAG: hypothetical protein NTZ69_07905 [Bacteroidia bacterium]|nr:hypothetical protein [Bacteroidia bacterium]
MSRSIYHYSSKSTSAEGFTIFKNFENNGRVEIHSEVDKDKNDYSDLLMISCEFAKMGRIVQVLPKLHFKDKRYKEIFGGLIGTKYEGKCPDLKICDHFFEYEGFISNNPKTNFSNMLRRGLNQSSHIIIKDCNITFDHIKRTCIQRIREAHIIDEVWVMKNSKIELVFKSKASKS